MDKKSPIRNSVYDASKFEASWLVLEKCVKNILNNATDYSQFEYLYFLVYKLVVGNFGQPIYPRLQAVIVSHLQNKVKNEIVNLPFATFLESLVHLWTNYYEAMGRIQDIFLYLDKVLSTSKYVDSLYSLQISTFRDEVVTQAQMKERQNSCLLNMIEQERNGRSMDRTLINRICSMLMLMGMGGRGIYEDIFENAFLRATEEKYYEASLLFLTESEGIQNYIDLLQVIFASEKERAEQCFDPTTLPLLISQLEHVLIRVHLEYLARNENSVMWQLLARGELDTFENLSQILQRIPEGTTATVDCVCNYVADKAKKDLAGFHSNMPIDMTSSSSFVQKLKQIFGYTQQIATVTNTTNNPLIEKRLKIVINGVKKFTEYLACYIHEILRKKHHGTLLTEEEITKEVDDWLTLFHYMENKVEFELMLRQNLGKRILGRQTYDTHTEKDFLKKLERVCGFVFTNKMQHMINDYETYVKLNETFSETTKPSSHIKSLVQILSPTYWPVPQSAISCNFPEEINEVFQQFSFFYLCNTKHKTLYVLPQMGDAELVLHMHSEHHPKSPHLRRYTLKVTTLQMTVLMLFNHIDTLTYENIQMTTAIPDSELKNCLLTLSTPSNDTNQTILQRHKASEDIEPGDEFSFNNDFYSKRHCVHVPSRPANHELAAARQQEIQEVDHAWELQAAIMRVAKLLKRVHELRLVLLVREAVKHRFNPSPDAIKSQIPFLVTNGYLQCAKDNSKIYEYIP